MPQTLRKHGGSTRRVGLALNLSPLGENRYRPTLRRLGQDNRLREVRRLVLRRCGLSRYTQLFETLARSPYLAQVKEVDLGSTPCELGGDDFNFGLREPLKSGKAVGFCRTLRKVILSWDADPLWGDEYH